MKHYYKILSGALAIFVCFFIAIIATWYLFVHDTEVLGATTKITRGITYTSANNSGLNKLDVYSPNDGTSHPVVIFIHGGGWRTGTRLIDGDKNSFFTGNGFVYVTIDYRLSPDIMHPEHTKDVASAIAWVSANIQQYGGNKDQIYLMGHSAGAHLAALVSTDASYLKNNGLDLRVIKGTILLDGAGFDIPYLMQINPAYFKSLYEVPFGVDPTVLKNASPLTHVDAGKNIPPMLFLYTSRPTAVLENSRMFQVMKNKGLTYQEVKYPTEDHMTIVENFGKPNHAPTAKALEFIYSLQGAK